MHNIEDIGVKSILLNMFSGNDERIKDALLLLFENSSFLDEVVMSDLSPYWHAKICSIAAIHNYNKGNFVSTLDFALKTESLHSDFDLLKKSGIAAYKIKKISMARELLEKANNLDSSDYFVNELLGTICFSKKQYHEAREYFIKALLENNKLRSATMYLAIIHARMEDKNNAYYYFSLYEERQKNRLQVSIVKAKIDIDINGFDVIKSVSKVEKQHQYQYLSKITEYSLKHGKYHYLEAIHACKVDRCYSSLSFDDYFKVITASRLSYNYKIAEEVSEQARQRFGSSSIHYPGFDSNDSFFIPEDNRPGAPLIISFQGFNSKLVEHYPARVRFEEVNYNDLIKLKFAFIGFSKQYNNYNYIFVRDVYQTWYQINFDAYISFLKDEIKNLKPSKVICVGISAGGFAALLFGQKLSADLVFAFSPRVTAFTTSLNPYRHMLNNRYLLGAYSTSDIGHAVSLDGGFIPKTYIYYCEGMVVDNNSIKTLLTDKNLMLNPIDCYQHNVIKEAGKDLVFSNMVDIIENSY